MYSATKCPHPDLIVSPVYSSYTYTAEELSVTAVAMWQRISEYSSEKLLTKFVGIQCNSKLLENLFFHLNEQYIPITHFCNPSGSLLISSDSRMWENLEWESFGECCLIANWIPVSRFPKIFHAILLHQWWFNKVFSFQNFLINKYMVHWINPYRFV